MIEDEFADLRPAGALPAAAARSAGWGFLALFAVLGFVTYRKFRR